MSPGQPEPLNFRDRCVRTSDRADRSAAPDGLTFIGEKNSKKKTEMNKPKFKVQSSTFKAQALVVCNVRPSHFSRHKRGGIIYLVQPPLG